MGESRRTLMARTARPVKLRNKWRIRWIDADGTRQSAVYEKFGDADKALRRVQTETDQVKTGERDRPPPPKTFNDLADYWVENRLPRQRDQDRDLSVLRCHLRPAFGPLLLTEITLERIDTLVRSRRHLSPHTIHNFLTLLISMLNGAIDLGWLRGHTSRP